jgi:hypothetical protein
MTTVLVIVAILLVGSAIWGFRVPGRGKQVRVPSETLARRDHVAMPYAWPMQYTPLMVSFFCLWVLDTETRLQQVLLVFLALAAASSTLVCVNRLTGRSEHDSAKKGRQNSKTKCSKR